MGTLKGCILVDTVLCIHVCTILCFPQVVFSNQHYTKAVYGGSIPAELGFCTGLSDILLHENLLEGTIPDLGTLIMLQWLDLFDKYLTGTVPRQLGLLTELEFLDLSCQAELDGTLPTVRSLDC
jgi:hypothetical protein